MGRGGRRGSVSVMYEVVISLVLLGFFAAVTYTYISANATGEAFFSRFYAFDIASSAEVVNSAYGDVILRYDNLKPNLDLTFWFTNGRVAVAKPISPRYEVGEGTTTHREALPPRGAGKINVDGVPVWDAPTSAREYYGFAELYPVETAIVKPKYLSLRKAGQTFAITEADSIVSTCPSTQPVIKVEDAKVFLKIDGTLTEKEKKDINDAFSQVIGGTQVKIVEETSSNIKIFLTKKTGTNNTLITAPTSIHGQRFACIFDGTLFSLSLVDFEANKPSSSGNSFDVRITLTVSNEINVKNEHIGQALAHALARYYG